MCTSLKLLVLAITVSAAAAWLPPERCEQRSHRTKADSVNTMIYDVSPIRQNISAIAASQHAVVNETNKNYKFHSVPTKIELDAEEGEAITNYRAFMPYDCRFYTYDPSLLTSVYCDQGIECKLSHTVSTTKSYTATEGYEWGVKITATGKLSFGEIGGELTTGQTFSCAYTIGETTTKTVECSSSLGLKTLQLYSVQSDMQCQFGELKYKYSKRNNRAGATLKLPEDYMRKLYEDHKYLFYSFLRVLDIDRAPDDLLAKMMTGMPDYNPYTDLVSFSLYDNKVDVVYFDFVDFQPSFQKVIPFTSKDGNAVQQFACIASD